jgi:hypothetical protein
MKGLSILLGTSECSIITALASASAPLSQALLNVEQRETSITVYSSRNLDLYIRMSRLYVLGSQELCGNLDDTLSRLTSVMNVTSVRACVYYQIWYSSERPLVLVFIGHVYLVSVLNAAL